MSNGVSTVEDPLDSTCLNTSEQATRPNKLKNIQPSSPVYNLTKNKKEII